MRRRGKKKRKRDGAILEAHGLDVLDLPPNVLHVVKLLDSHLRHCRRCRGGRFSWRRRA